MVPCTPCPANAPEIPWIPCTPWIPWTPIFPSLQSQLTISFKPCATEVYWVIIVVPWQIIFSPKYITQSASYTSEHCSGSGHVNWGSHEIGVVNPSLQKKFWLGWLLSV